MLTFILSLLSNARCPLVQAVEVVSVETRASSPHPSILPTILHKPPACGPSRWVTMLLLRADEEGASACCCCPPSSAWVVPSCFPILLCLPHRPPNMKPGPSSELWETFFRCLYFQTTKDQFVKVQFNKFLLGNHSDGCPNDYVEVNGQRSAQGRVLECSDYCLFCFFFLVFLICKRVRNMQPSNIQFS